VLWDKFPQIVDATEPGGSGDIYAGLTVEERQVLAEVTRLGFPPRSWFDVARLAQGYTAVWPHPQPGTGSRRRTMTCRHRNRRHHPNRGKLPSLSTLHRTRAPAPGAQRCHPRRAVDGRRPPSEALVAVSAGMRSQRAKRS
jgi:hypothetical protein